jgi:hypothetical protein
MEGGQLKRERRLWCNGRGYGKAGPRLRRDLRSWWRGVIRTRPMKTRAAQIMHGLLATLSILLATGCGDRQASSSQSTSTPTIDAKEGPALKELEAKVGIAFPTNAVLVNATDGGGRDPSYGYYAWGVFSPTAITMPVMKAPGVKDYLNLPLENTTTFVQGKMRSRKISQPQSAFSSEWETNGYDFRGTLVRTAQGDYLAIEQFRKK